MLIILNDAESVPPSVYSSVSLSASVAVIALLIFVSVAVFSATERMAVLPVVKIGALFVGDSSTFVMLMVTLIVSLPKLPSDTVMVTE